MLLTLRTTNTHGNARSTADAVITALSPAAWYRNATDVVSSGGFASIWADYASSDKGLVLPGVAGNYASTPDANPLDITGDIDIAVRVSLDDWTPGAGANCLVGKFIGSGLSGYYFAIDTLGRPQMRWGTGAASVTESIATAFGFTDGTTNWVRITLDIDDGAGHYLLKGWYAADSETVPSSWTQLGATVTGASTTVIGGNSTALGVGQDPSIDTRADGVIYRAIVKDGIDGTTVFDADFSAQAIGTGSFTESSSNAATVTINTSGALPAHIGKARDLLQGTGTNQPAYAAGVFTFDGADNFMSVSYVSAQPRTRVFVLKQITWGTDHIFNSAASTNVGVYQNGSSPKIELYAGTAVPAGGNSNLAVDTYGILVGVFNGASSSLRINNSAKSSGNAGATNPTGLGVGGYVPGLSAFSNIAVLEIVDFPSALSDAEQDSVVTALNNALTVF